MARTASMSVRMAETQIGSAPVIVTSANRALLRKWAVAIGYNSATAYKFSNVELANLYAERGPSTIPGVPASMVDSERAWNHAGFPTLPAPRNDVPVPMNAPASDAQKQLADALAIIMGDRKAPVDENQVRQIVGEMLDKRPADLDETRVTELARAVLDSARITRLEVVSPAGIAHIDGLVHGATLNVIRVVSLGHPVMLVGPAGCGKTAMGETVAKALSLNLYITSTVFDTHELLGFVDGMGNYHSTAFRQAFEHGGVWIADEVDAWDAAALLAANSALANGFVTFPDSTAPVRRHASFRMIATANTYGHGADRLYVGRNELDAASLDRFATFAVDYDEKIETAMANGNAVWLDRVWTVRNIVRAKNIRHVVSTRAIIMGAQALAAGIDQTTVESLYLFKGMSATDRAKISD